MAVESGSIETKYRGYRMRSRLEARWAVYFDALGCKWQYELDGKKTSAGWYLPDFWLDTVGMWAEVKATKLSDDELRKANALVEMTRKSLVMLIGTPEYKPYYVSRFCTDAHRGPGTMIIPAHDHVEYATCLLSARLLTNERSFVWEPDENEPPCNVALAAVDAARAARFEHGESGQIRFTTKHRPDMTVKEILVAVAEKGGVFYVENGELKCRGIMPAQDDPIRVAINRRRDELMALFPASRPPVVAVPEPMSDRLKRAENQLLSKWDGLGIAPEPETERPWWEGDEDE